VILDSSKSPVVMEEITDPQELARARVQRERFNRNWAWFAARADEAYASHRGKCLCVAGQELFVGETAQEVLARAAAAHPEDDGRFTLYVPRERMARIYAHQGRVVSLRGRDDPAFASGQGAGR
jgi:hypothetical protein